MKNTCHCGAAMVKRVYPMKPQKTKKGALVIGLLRKMEHCSKAVLHTYSEESLKDLDTDRMRALTAASPQLHPSSLHTGLGLTEEVTQ